MRTRWLIAALVAALALAGCGGAQKGPTDPKTPTANYVQKTPQTPAAPQTQDQRPTPSGKQWSEPPAMQIDPNKQYTATIKTNMGDIKVELFAKVAPKTVNNFVFLAREKFYDGIIFHRIVKGFMVQTGDPKGTGGGGPGYKFEDELPPKQPYDLGIMAMANAGRNTNGSQFFICNAPKCGGLDGAPNYTQFGKVVAGLDVLDKISSVETVMGADGAKSKPVTPPWIQTVIIEEK